MPRRFSRSSCTAAKVWCCSGWTGRKASLPTISSGLNLLLIRDQRIAVSYMIEAVRIFDHYEFRTKQETAKTALTQLALHKPPRQPGQVPWWSEDYTNSQKIRDRVLFPDMRGGG
jgi:hypothetical protein